MRGHTNNFDALRLAGALTVLAGHQYAIMGQPVPVVIGFKHIATVAVYMFFSISGYLIAKSWHNDPNGFRFLARRFLRMAPGWFVLILLSLSVHIGLGISQFPNNPLPAFNGSLWTLEWEILCYVVLAGVCIFMPLRIGALLALGALLICWRLSVFKNGPELGLMFCAGALLYAYPVKRWGQLAVGLAPLYFIVRSEPYLVLLLTVPAVSVWAGVSSWPYVRRIGRFGDFSYGTYIYAFPVQQFGVMLLGKDQPYLPMLSLSIGVTAVFAVLSWHYIERPSIALGRSLASEREGTQRVIHPAGSQPGS
jgi:peptidoglycan/LPS O-acetylase OafA/YrhL